jgi:hypothetical protein
MEERTLYSKKSNDCVKVTDIYLFQMVDHQLKKHSELIVIRIIIIIIYHHFF